jgi:hypothetical protein
MALVRTNVSEEHIASILMVTRIDKLGTTLAVTRLPSLSTLMLEPIRSSEASVLTRAIRHNFPEGGILF